MVPEMQRLILVAASGLAREVLPVVRPRFDEILVVDDDPTSWGRVLRGAIVEGGLEVVDRYHDARLLVCAGPGAVRRSLVARLRELGVGPDRYTVAVHPSVDVPSGCRIGEGSILLAHVALTADVTVGRHVVVMPNATLTHDCVLDDYATVCAGVSLAGGVHVREAAYLGMNASVREGLTVGAESVLGMGGVMLEDLPPRQCWAGVPARLLASQPARVSSSVREAVS